MDPVHFHLALNHFPLAAGLTGFLLAGLGWLRKNAEFQKAGLGILLAAALILGPVYLSGERSEERVEHLPGVSEALIERHEDAAKPVLAGFLLLGAACGVVLMGFRQPPALTRCTAGILALSAVVLALSFRAAALGGEIRHTEIRRGDARQAESGGDPGARTF